MNIQIPKVSIIVPVHNAGERFIRCLDTLIGQTLREIEIILVLDCPTDGSDKTAKEYAAKDSRIIILENETNLHIGNSRNRGLEIAQGEYIGFSDHDDYRELTMYEELYSKAIAEEADVVLSLLENDKDLITAFSKYGETIYSREFILKDLIGFGYEDNSGALFVRVNSNLYKRNLLISNQIEFVNTNKITPEDVIFQIEAIFLSTQIVTVKKQFYYHVKHEQNEGGKYSYIGYEKRSAGLAEIYLFLQKKKIFEYYKNDFYKGVTKQFLNSLAGTIYPQRSIIQFFKAVKKLRSYSFCKEAFANYSLPPVKHQLFRKFLIKLLN